MPTFEQLRGYQQLEIGEESLSRLKDIRSAREAAITPEPLGVGPEGRQIEGPVQEPTPEQTIENFATELEKLGRVEESQKVRASQVAIKTAQEDLAAAQARHTTQAALQAAQLIKTGHQAKGLEIIQRFDPSITSIEMAEGGNFLIKTQQNPQGSLIPETSIIEAATNAETQYAGMMAERRRKEAEARTPLPQKATTADVKLLAVALKSEAYDDIIPNASKLDERERAMLSLDLLDKAKGLQAEAKKQGQILDGDQARQMAAIALQDRVKQKSYFGTQWPSYSPVTKKEPEKKEDKEEQAPKWSTADERNIKKIMEQNKDKNVTREQAESAYTKWKGR